MVNHSILLVEGNPDDADLALPAFKESGIGDKAWVARDGQEAVGYPLGGSRAGHLPKADLLDINLPRADGFEVVRHLRADPRIHCLLVVILGSFREERGYIQKSLDFPSFVELARNMGEYWLSLNILPEACRH